MTRAGKFRMYGSATVMALAVVAFVAGCGSAGSTNTSSQSNTNASATNSGQTSSGKATGDATVGLKLFQQNCAMCHSTGSNRVVGPGLKGIMTKSKLPNGRAVSDANVQDWIRTGGGGMPGFPQLTDKQRADIVAYLHTLN